MMCGSAGSAARNGAVFHDHEGFTTVWSSKSFAIMKFRSGVRVAAAERSSRDGMRDRPGLARPGPRTPATWAGHSRFPQATTVRNHKRQGPFPEPARYCQTRPDDVGAATTPLAGRWRGCFAGGHAARTPRGRVGHERQDDERAGKSVRFVFRCRPVRRGGALAQWQSSGLLTHWFRVRPPGAPPASPLQRSWIEMGVITPITIHALGSATCRGPLRRAGAVWPTRDPEVGCGRSAGPDKRVAWARSGAWPPRAQTRKGENPQPCQ